MSLSMSLPLRLWARAGTMAMAAALVAACSSSASTPAAPVAGVTTAPTAMTTPVANPTDTAAASFVMPSLATGVPTSLDPCQLVSASDASALTGASYTVGKEETTSGASKICWYGAQTKNVFEVVVAQAPDVATAQKAKDAVLAEVSGQTGGLPVHPVALTGVGDNAEFISFSAIGIHAAGIYVLKGAVFFALVDEVTGSDAPSQAAMVAAAQAVIAKLP